MRHRAQALIMLPIAASLIVAAPVASQEVRVSGLRASPDHALLGTPRGIGVELGWRWADRLGVRLGYEHYRHDFRGFGTTCAGLVPAIEDCSDEPRDERARMNGLVLSAPATVSSGPQLRFDLVPSLRAVSVSSEQAGLESGRTRSATKRMFAVAIGGDAVLAPVGDGPLRLHLGAHTGLFLPFRRVIIADGYTPFEDGIRFSSLQLGASLVFD